MRTWLWVDYRNKTLEDTLLRSAVWLLTFWIKCHTSQSVIVLRRPSNYASEYTPDLVLQASDMTSVASYQWEIIIIMLVYYAMTNRNAMKLRCTVLYCNSIMFHRSIKWWKNGPTCRRQNVNEPKIKSIAYSRGTAICQDRAICSIHASS